MNKGKDIRPYNDKGQRHGLWEIYYNDGELWSKRFYQNDKLVGYEEIFFITGVNNCNGKLSRKKYYL